MADHPKLIHLGDLSTGHPCRLAGNVDQQCPLLPEPHLLRLRLKNHSTSLKSKCVLLSLEGPGLDSPSLEGLGRSSPELHFTENAKRVFQLNSHTEREDLGKLGKLAEEIRSSGQQEGGREPQATRKRLREA